MRRLYQLRDDVTIPGRWHLGEVRSESGDEPQLYSGVACDNRPLIAEVTRAGRVLDFSLTSFAVPIASGQLAKTVADVAGPDVQRLPVRIGGQSGFEVLNAVRVVHCLDEARSEFMKWTERDHRADLAGQYRQVTKLLLDPRLIPEDAEFFRVQDWLVALIVSAGVKTAMEKAGCLGAKFNLVTP